MSVGRHPLVESWWIAILILLDGLFEVVGCTSGTGAISGLVKDVSSSEGPTEESEVLSK